MDLRPGPNDVRHLAPGVYFVREQPQASSPRLQAVTRVVVAKWQKPSPAAGVPPLDFTPEGGYTVLEA